MVSARRQRRPGLILDRDGVINLDTGYLHRIEECRFVDGIFELLLAFAARGFAIAIATNQAGIGRGYYGQAEFCRLMDWMLAEFRGRGVTIERVYHCPDHPTEGIGVYRRENPWRKPGPGMLRQAIEDLRLDPARSWAIGDRPTDVAAAEAAGIAERVLLDPSAARVERQAGHWIVPSLNAVHGLLERWAAGEPTLSARSGRSARTGPSSNPR